MARAAGTGTLNVSGTSSLSLGNVGLKFGATGATAGVGIVNLLGGTITTNMVQSSATTAIFDFNGGTLKAGNTPSATFMTGLTNAYVYSGGGTIDNGGNNITISQALLAPTGNSRASPPPDSRSTAAAATSIRRS